MDGQHETDDQRAAYVALAMTPGMGPARLRSLLSVCHTPLGAYSAPFAFLCTVPLISRAIVTAIKASSPDAGHRLLRRMAERGSAVLLPHDAAFPAALHDIPDPPLLLFAHGDLSLLTRPAIAVVGSRDHSSYGADVCRSFARAFAAAGGVIVSGMARGLDAVAHSAALEANGGTIGVLGNGLGVIYPAANRALYQQVTARGLLLTEFPPGERPNAGSFPRRNRLISGLAKITLVIEAALGSGALITAEAALDQGKDVLAVPGPITSPTSAGTNRLIRDGAAPLLEPADLFARYPELSQNPSAKSGMLQAEAIGAPLPDTLTESERMVAELLTPHPKHIDEIATEAARPVHEILAALGALELAGVAEQYAGRRFRRA